MQEFRENFLALWKNKKYSVLLGLTALFSYGFMVTHHAIGIDDTPYTYYFEEGLSAIVGRWVTFLLNKVVSIGEFAPYLTDLAGVLIFMAAVTVWAALFRSILKKKVPEWGYLVFAAVFLSSPLISEVYTYFLHNAVSLGYLCIGLSLWCFKGCQEAQGRTGRGKAAAGCLCFLWIGLGCYESFMVVWLLGILLLLLTEAYAGVKRKVLPYLCAAAGIALGGIVLRSLMIGTVTAVFGLGGMKEDAVQRSVSEMVGWMFEQGAGAELAMLLKRVYVMYGVFAFAYFPIRIFVLSGAVMLAAAVYYSIRKKNPWICLLTAGSFIACFLLVLVEGKATLYRSAQFLPVICGYGALLAVYSVYGFTGGSCCRKHKKIGTGCLWAMEIVAAILIWNQCADMNRWFYVDYTKYESAKETAGQIAYALEKDFDTNKPVIFTGIYTIPQSLIQDAYVPYNSDTFYKMKRWTDWLDEHLLEKFYRDYGVWVAQTPSLSVIDWGRSAFGNDTELVKFFEMHGYSLVPYLETENFESIESYSLQLPHFPKEGSIVDRGEYIIVHF